LGVVVLGAWLVLLWSCDGDGGDEYEGGDGDVDGDTDGDVDGDVDGDTDGDPDYGHYACELNPALDPIAWYCGNTGGAFVPEHEVGQKRANAWGLYDTLGSSYEWCNDWYQEDLGRGSVTDPWGPATGLETDLFGSAARTIRGGCWSDNAGGLRAANRGYIPPDFHNGGLRPARTIP
jgi:formylglycine-generating enzyme required for sulfatase activity